MPELPEVEVLVRHLEPSLRGRVILSVKVRRPKVVLPTSVSAFTRRLRGARFGGLTRRGKFLVFRFEPPAGRGAFTLCGHLGMTGRMFLAPATTALPKHAAVVLGLDDTTFVYEDTRYFGRLTLDDTPLARLGPEPLGPEFSVDHLAGALRKSRQAIKVRLLDQSLVAGVGNIYASEALFRARISPRLAAGRLTRAELVRLRREVRRVLSEAIRWGSTVPLNWSGAGARDGLFYYGRPPESVDYYEERLCVYDRAGLPCARCRTPIRRIVQAARATYFCPTCQRAAKSKTKMP